MFRPIHSSAMLAVTAALLGASPSFAAEAVKAPTERAAPSVTVTNVSRQSISDTAIVTGTLVPREEVLVAAQIDGYAIKEILVEEGDRVTAGQTLARLTREMIDTALAQNTAQLARAEANIASARASIVEADSSSSQAQASFQRAQTLRAGGITSVDVFEQREAASQQAAARANSAREQLRLAEADKALVEAQRQELQVRLDRSEIKAPTDGIISRRTARLGAIAAGSVDPLFRIIRDGAIELEADVAEMNLARVAIGQKATVRPAGWDKDLPATVRLVSPEITRTTRLGRVRLALETPERLTIGSFARGTIEIARREAVVAPLSAVLFTSEGSRVQVVKDGVVETRPIVTGIRAAGLIEIVSGLEPGEAIVTISGTFLRNGDRVTPVQPK